MPSHCAPKDRLNVPEVLLKDMCSMVHPSNHLFSVKRLIYLLRAPKETTFVCAATPACSPTVLQTNER